MVRRVGAITALLSIAACAAAVGVSQAAGKRTTPKTTTLVVALPAILPGYAPLYIAQDKGYFAKAGLNVKIDYVGATNTVGTIVAGRADLAIQGSTSALSPAVQGVDTSIIYSFTGGGTSGSVYAAPSVKSWKDCTHLVAAGPDTNYYASATLEQQILHGSWTLTPVGDPSTVVAEVGSGQADCGEMDPGPFDALAAQGKVHLVLDTTKPSTLPLPVRKFFSNENEASIWGLKSNLAKKQAAVAAFLRAFHEAVHYLTTAKPSTTASMLRKESVYKTYTNSQMASAVAAYAAFWDKPCKGYLPAASWNNSLRFYKTGGATFIHFGSPTWSYAKRVDMSYYDKAIGRPKTCA